MSTIIDGYNLLHVTGIFGQGRGPGGLERARTALLNFVAASLSEKEIKKATVVFDAHDAPPGLPREVKHRGLTVRYASGYENADAMIEELIAQHHAPRELTVVSSDHRIQRAARRRKATAIDSENWYSDALRRRMAADPRHANGAEANHAKPTAPLSDKEVEYWLAEFADCEPLTNNEQELNQKETRQAQQPKKQSAKEQLPEDDSLRNPFPPGYGEDLL